MTPERARQAYQVLLDPTLGFYRDVALNEAGIRIVLELRSRYGLPRKELSDPARCVDPGYRERALARRAAGAN